MPAFEAFEQRVYTPDWENEMHFGFPSLDVMQYFQIRRGLRFKKFISVHTESVSFIYNIMGFQGHLQLG